MNVGRLKFKEEGFRIVKRQLSRIYYLIFPQRKKTKMYAGNYINFTFGLGKQGKKKKKTYTPILILLELFCLSKNTYSKMDV